mgnify:CR=1 FL=1
MIFFAPLKFIRLLIAFKPSPVIRHIGLTVTRILVRSAVILFYIERIFVSFLLAWEQCQ